MDIFKDTLLFGKYQLCRTLGHGQSGTVYLAKHLSLEEYRAIKQIPKTNTEYKRFRREALILKSIRHPGIPIVYDLEEDEHFCYIIEEFLEGDSLYALVSRMGHFSKTMTIQYGIQICHLVNTLHSARPNPILYLDLQPENLLICHDSVKLVDFDHAIHLNEADRLTKRYGTIGCAAPEQYTDAVLDERTDIYAIGAILYYMLTGYFPESMPSYPREQIDQSMASVIHRCLKKDTCQRYQSVTQLCKKLEKLQKQMKAKTQDVLQKDIPSSLTIAVAGSASGTGATHIAIGLAVRLREHGLSVLYEEKNKSCTVGQMASYMNASMDRYGIYHIYGLPMLPQYGKSIKLESHSYPIIIQDYGASYELLSHTEADYYLLVCGSKPWQWESAKKAVQFLKNLPGTAIIYNQFCRQFSFKLPVQAKDADVFLMPNYSHPFYYGKCIKQVYEEIFLSLTSRRTGGILQKFFAKKQ